MNVLLLIGSPKVKQSNSETLGDYLLQRLSKNGAATQKIFIRQTLHDAGKMEKLLSAVDACDVLIFSFPLYVDSLPAGLIKVLETIAESRQRLENPPPQTLLTICNCGFPEAKHNETALAIFKCFAKETNLQWAGGLSLGGGEMLGGKPLSALGGMAKNQIKALNMAAEAITEGKNLPQEAVNFFRKSLIPKWLYLICGSIGWKYQAMKNGVYRKMREQPYK